MTKTLEGRTILITRSRTQSGDLRALLEERGATVLEVPTIEIRVRSGAEIDEAIAHLCDYDWLIFTSANGAQIFFERAGQLGVKRFPRICAIGPATRRQVEAYGCQVDLLPELYQAEGVLKSFLEFHQGAVEHLKVLLPRAGQARDVLPQELRRRGARVDVLAVYDTVVPRDGRQCLQEALRCGSPDLITFTSSSTVRHLLRLAEEEGLKDLRCAVIGPITAATAREHGLQVVVEAKSFTIPGLVRAIESYFSCITQS